MKCVFRRVLSLVVIGCCAAQVVADEVSTADDVLRRFADSDQAAGWMSKRSYMRRLDDASWKTRMLAMQRLVARGRASVPSVVELLKSDDVATRIMAAQVAGYLAPHFPRAALLAATSDDDAAVRLYAVDALGMQGGKDLAAELEPLRKREKNRDVLKHIGYALERQQQGVAPEVIATLRDWDPRTIDTAQVGKPAPDFALQNVAGETIRLADYRGKQPVVLVFIYGDT